MDKLKICIEVLREPNAIYLAEKEIKKYLQDEAATPTTSLDQLSAAVDDEAEMCQGDKDFWITTQEFVRSRLPDDKDDWDKDQRCTAMTSWKPIKDAPKDGRSVLLWARIKTVPPGNVDFSPIVGFWHKDIEQWRVAPEHLSGEVLIPTYWTKIPEVPKAWSLLNVDR